MTDRTTSLEQPQETSSPEAGSDRPELLRELDRRDEEILRLRDLLISKDMELGALRGRLTMLEESSQRLSNFAARIPIPGATRLLQGLIRLVQGYRG
jgi:hypothetical protein